MRDSSTVPVQRLMALRKYPGLADADLAELAVLADNVVEEEFVAGAVITRVGRVPAIHLILEGKIEMGDVAWGPHDLVGSIEAMAGRAVTAPMVASVDTRTLQLAPGDFADVLEDNFGLLSNVRRAIARRLLATRRGPSHRTQPAVTSTQPLGLVDRLLALRHLLPFTNGKIHALAALAETAREVHWPANTSVTRTGDPAIDSYVILEGAVRIRSGQRVIGPGEAVGLIESLAEVSQRDTADTLTPVRALQISTSAILDLIEDHTDLGLAVIASMAGELLDRARATRGDETDTVN